MKDVQVSVRGVQFTEEDNEPIEVICMGKRYEKNGKTYVIYDEIVQDEDNELPQIVKNTLKIDGEQVEIIKRGSQGTHMVFLEGQSHVTCYSTPFGEVGVTLNTNQVDIKDNNEELRVQVKYDLEMNGAFIAKCHVDISVH